jgi:KUP system potassium uptake protein
VIGDPSDGLPPQGGGGPVDSPDENGPPGTGPTGESPGPAGRYLATLTLAAMGVVFGDIGTSPLYALRECFRGPHGIDLTPDNVVGILSLIVWSLVLVISVKYLGFVLRADNGGEGGILALMALIRPEHPVTPGRESRRWLVLMLGLFGAALLYGDGMITPAISVLSAFEGLEVATPVLHPYVVPVTIVVLIGLFAFQRHGTATVGAVFGPIVMAWFTTLAVLGLTHIAREPSVLLALSPYPATRFFLHNGWDGFLVLGTVFLVVTGGEALYADMGHFGRRPIRLGWFCVALPCLILNYFGQGALLIRDPATAVNPFYHLVPRWGLIPLIALATAATIIASQAVISGAYSLTRQAVQLGYSPRLRIDHTSSEEIGQIYLPGVNWTLMLATIAVVLGFGSSSSLAAAYGVAVTSTMVITTLLLFVVARERWGWSLPAATGLTAMFLVVDLAFFGANILKVPHGGWFPLVVGAGIYTLMATWNRGREVLRTRLHEAWIPLRIVLADIAADPPYRVAGTAVYLVSTPDVTPPGLIHNLTHHKVLHERVIFLSVVTEEIPYVPQRRRIELDEIGNGCFTVITRYGFMQHPNVPLVLQQLEARGLKVPLEATSYFLGRETIIPTRHPGMARWRETVFAFMSRNALPATQFFGIPPGQVFEVGVQVEM